MTGKKRSSIYAKSTIPSSAGVPPQSSSISQVSSVGTSILGNIVQGFTFGTGSALGHRAVSAVFDERKPNDVVTHSTQHTDSLCTGLFTSLQNCMQHNDAETCKELLAQHANLCSSSKST